MMITSILTKLIHDQSLNNRDFEELIKYELQDINRAIALDINDDNVEKVIRERSLLFSQIFPLISIKNPLLLWSLWLPLAVKISNDKEQINKPLIQGILGSQGTGKSTLSHILQIILNYLGKTTICLSLDDLYLTHQERIELKARDPRLIFRGPPSTHDINLGLKVMEQFLNKQRIYLPRFDKSLHNGSGDRLKSEISDRADVLIFEGWFVGVRPLEEPLFNHPPHPIITPEDQQFAKDMNQQLKTYLPLWDKLDKLIVLYPQDYRFSLQWRKEAEHKMIAEGKKGMSDQEIEQFVNYFWRSLHPQLFITPLIKNKKYVDLVIEIKEDHSVDKTY